MSNLLKLILLIAFVAIAEGFSTSVGAFGNYSSIVEAYNDAYSIVMNDTDYTEINIELDSETFSGAGNVNLNFTSFLKNRLVLKSSSEAIIDCEFNSRFFFINRPALNPNQTLVNHIEIAIEGLMIKNCNATGPFNVTSGGAIYIASNYTQLFITNSTFQNNSASLNGDGGALYLLGPTQMIDNYTIPLSLYLNNVVFLNNSAPTGEGGSFALLNGNYSINNTQFTNNSASDGGAMYTNNCESESNIRNSIWTQNRATDQGAAIYAISSSAFCTNCLFNNNTGRSSGAVDLRLSAFICTSCNFTNNRASGQGGAVNLQNAGISTIDSGFYGNSAGLYGGCISAVSSNIRFNKTLITGNSAGSYGGAVYALSDSKVTGNFVEFSANRAYDGGVLYIQYNVKVTLTNSVFINNSASSDGGAIYCSASNLALNSVQFDNNQSPSDSDVHCASEVPGTFCEISGDSVYTDKCARPKADTGLTAQGKAIVGLVVGILGGALLIWIIAFIVYFSKKENRRSQGMYLSLLGDKRETNVEMGMRVSDE